jgi:hypothetical protein
VILHNVATSPDDARRNEINRVCFHFQGLLGSFDETGLVLIDRFTDTQIDAHLAEKFSVGVTGLPGGTQRLWRVLGFHYTAVGQSNFCTLIDIIVGSLRFAINAHTRNDASRLETARLLLRMLEPLFYRERGRPVSEISFFFSPKTIIVPDFRARYTALKQFLADQGIDTAQPIVDT